MERVLWTLAMVAVIGLAALALWWGWRNRARRQADIPAPAALPADVGTDTEHGGIVAPLAGVYVSTTRSGAWQDRVVVHGLGRRAKGDLVLRPDGVLVDRVGEPPLFLPRADLRTVTVSPGIAGKVMGLPEGIVLLTWQTGDVLLDSGFRSDDPEEQRAWVDAAQAALAEPPPAGDDPATDPVIDATVVHPHTDPHTGTPQEGRA
ncbi:PH-like domain-containing protein [Nakamurella leprariae]|uniref:Transporter n=1 Tax=Nakamurella leprariae TaxID=2803911 RepID=A0A939BX62_9ACTN|nr:transporter [Nakamurella leprariae]MBM9468233.1 transporter [Nakamurella leprariae]